MTRRRVQARIAILLLTASIVGVSACGSAPAPSPPGVSGGPSRLPQPSGTGAPGRTARPGSTAPIASVEASFAGVFPQSATFAGVVFTVTGARLTNTHPYTMFGTPRPGPDLFGVLSVNARNATSGRVNYRFTDEAFALRTWSGRLLPRVHRPGAGPWSNLAAGASADDDVVFGLPEPQALDGAALLVGAGDDVRASVPLSVAAPAPEIPAPVLATRDGPVLATPVEWTIETGTATFDAPAKACCTPAGVRADEGTMFIALTVTGTVKGSKYGQTTVSSDAVRLLVDGSPLKAAAAAGKANVKEGTGLTFDLAWLVPSDAAAYALVVGFGTPGPQTIDLTIGS